MRKLAQECKALNARLIDFLKQPEAVAKLVEYVTQPAGMESDDRRQFKYPFSSCEVRRMLSQQSALVTFARSFQSSSMMQQGIAHLYYRFVENDGGCPPEGNKCKESGSGDNDARNTVAPAACGSRGLG